MVIVLFSMFLSFFIINFIILTIQNTHLFGQSVWRIFINLTKILATIIGMMFYFVEK